MPEAGWHILGMTITLTLAVKMAIFGLLALITVVGALGVIFARSVVHAAFWLFPVFAGVAGIYLFNDAQFLAAVQVLIYIGAILVLFVFVVTLTRNPADVEQRQNNGMWWAAGLMALALLGAICGAALLTRWPEAVASAEGVVVPGTGTAVTGVQGIGIVLLQQYAVPFEIASVLLLAAIIGALVLAHREK